MERYTIKDAERSFEAFAKVMGGRVATSYNDVGAWRLDYNPIYGGVVIEEIANEHGGVSSPLGDTRKSPREFKTFVANYLLARDVEARKPIPVSTYEKDNGTRVSSHRRKSPRRRN